MDMKSSGTVLLSQVSAMDKKLSIYRDSPFQRRRGSARGRAGTATDQGLGDGAENSDASTQESDQKHSINITV